MTELTHLFSAKMLLFADIDNEYSDVDIFVIGRHRSGSVCQSVVDKQFIF